MLYFDSSIYKIHSDLIIYSPSYDNGAHLKAWALNGAYASNCNNGGLYSLSVSLWFSPDGPLDNLQGLLSYGDCFDDSPSYYISLDHDRACAGLNTHGFPNVEICTPITVSFLSYNFVSVHRRIIYHKYPCRIITMDTHF